MNLRSLVYLIGAVGRKICGESHLKWDDYNTIVPEVAAALSDWPNGFFHRLQELTADIPEGSPINLCKSPLYGIYQSLRSGITPWVDTAFIRKAISMFVVNHLGCGYRDEEFRSMKGNYVKRYVSFTEFARLVGIAQSSVPNVIAAHGLPTREIIRGRSKRILVDLSGARLPERVPGKVFRQSVAAKTIGISSAVLSCLKASGHFQVAHLPKSIPGYHEADIEVFMKRLADITLQPERSSAATQSLIRFGRITQSSWCSVEKRADVMRQLLDGTLTGFGSIDGTVGGILIPKSVVNSRDGRIIVVQDGENLFRRAVSQTSRGERLMGTFESASYLNCHQAVVRRLLRGGRIRAVKKQNVWLVRESILSEFATTYVQLGSVAKELRTNTAALIRFCKMRRVPMMFTESGYEQGVCAFIRREDQPKLLAINSIMQARSLRLKMRRLALAA
jgi:hypothetical protein